MTAEELKKFIKEALDKDTVAPLVGQMIKESLDTFETGLKENAPWKADLSQFEAKFAPGLLEYKDLGGGYYMTPNQSVVRTASHRAGMDPWVKLSPQMETFANVLKYLHAPDGMKGKLYTEAVQKALSEGTDSAGGYLVAEEFRAQLMEVVINDSIFMSRGWRIPMRTDSITVPKLAQSFDATKSYFGGITFVWTDEADEKTATDPSFEQLRLIAHKLAGIAYVSMELLADSAINFLNYVTGLYSRAMRWIWDYYFINGTGAGQPLGIANDPNVLTQARVTANAVKFADLANMDAQLDEHFMNPVWLMRKATGLVLRKETDSNGQLIWHDGYNTGLAGRAVPPTLLGYPVIFTPHCPTLGTTGDVILGDLSYYAIGSREELLVKTSEHYKFINNQLTMLVESRFDGKPGQSEANVILQAATGGTGYIS